MPKTFIVSLCHNGILGGGLYLTRESLVYKTGKLTVDDKYRNLVLPLKDIESLSWKQIVFPVASFRMNDGETYTMLIFNKPRFLKYYQEYTSSLQ